METGQGTDLEMWKCGNACREKMFAQKKRWNMERRKYGNREQMEIYMCTTEVQLCTVLVLGKRYKDGKWTTPGTWRN